MNSKKNQAKIRFYFNGQFKSVLNFRLPQKQEIS
jgi:hypothetical protein